MIKDLNLKAFTLAVAIIAFVVFAPLAVKAVTTQEFSVSQPEIFSTGTDSVTISWKTSSAQTSGTVYLGDSESRFDRTFKCDTYSYTHQITVNGLEKSKTYFYKIVVFDRDGQRYEFFTRSFSMKDVTDKNEPKIQDFKALSSSGGALVLRWTTSEDTSAKLAYGTDSEKLSRTVTISNMKTQQEAVITNLENGTYYIKLTATDRDKNQISKTITVTVSGSKADASLRIYDVTPMYFDSSKITGRSATISFKTSFPAKSRIYYGTSTKSISKKVEVSELHNLSHKAEIAGLKPLTTYYFRIETYDAPYKLSAKSNVMSFETGDFAVRYPSGSLVRGIGDLKVYIIYKNTKAWIESPAVFLGLGFKGEWVQDVDPATLEDYEEVKPIKDYHNHPSGSLIKYDNSPTVYFIEGPAKRPIANPDAFIRNGFSWDRIVTVSSRKEYYVTGDYID